MPPTPMMHPGMHMMGMMPPFPPHHMMPPGGPPMPGMPVSYACVYNDLTIRKCFSCVYIRVKISV